MDSGQQIVVLAACSNTKKSAIGAALQARSLESATLEARVEEWTSRLVETETPTFPARDLYAGDHWTTMRTLVEDLRPKHVVSLKVLSAGYGLVDSEAALKPYSASFSPQSADLVAEAPASARWWTQINCSVQLGSKPRTIGGIASDMPESVLVVVASDHYLRAIASDLQLAARRLDSPSQILIFSAGSPRIPGLSGHMLEFDSRFRQLVGGSNVSLNARVASHMLRTTPPGALNYDSVAASLRSISDTLAPIEQPVRTALTDAEVREFISNELAGSPTASATRSLRNLRDQGFACEQGRFHRLFREATNVT